MLTLDSPPANAVKKNSGKMIDGSRKAGLCVKLWICRQATPRATYDEPAHVRTSRVRSAREAAKMPTAQSMRVTAKPRHSAVSSQPVMTTERRPSSM